MNPAFWKQNNNHYCCEVYGLGCTAPNPAAIPSVDQTHPVIGHIDGVQIIGGHGTITGWACARTIDQPISVHLFAGGPAGTGQLVGGFTANVASEPAVAQNCNAHGAAYRFQIPLDAATEANFGGRTIYMHGISPIGLDNDALGNGGIFLFPRPQ